MNNKHDCELIKLYEQLEDLRKQVTTNTKALEYYEYLKDINKNDMMYGWIFSSNDILNDTLDDLDIYQKPYVRDVLTVYINELQNILLKVDL